MPNLPEFNIAQWFGMLSFALGISCFYQRDDKKLKIVMLAMNITNVVHYALLNAATACLSSILSLVRTGLALRTSSRLVAYTFIAITMTSGIYLSKNWYNLFPIIGTSIGTYALFCLKGIKLRIAFLTGAICWLINNIIVGSIGGTLLELTLLIVNLNTIRRIYFFNTQQPPKPFEKELINPKD